MAALKFSTLVYFVLICTCFEVNSVISKESQLFKSYRLYWGVYTRAGVADSSRLVFYLRVQSNKSSRPHRIQIAIHKWSKHGQTFLAAPEKSYVSDLTMCMDIQPNPGWDSATATNSKTLTVNRLHSKLNVPANRPLIKYSRRQLLNLRAKITVPTEVYSHLKSCGIMKSRGVRSGQLLKRKSGNILALERSRRCYCCCFESLQYCHKTFILHLFKSLKMYEQKILSRRQLQ